jgi:hypothetical protein
MSCRPHRWLLWEGKPILHVNTSNLVRAERSNQQRGRAPLCNASEFLSCLLRYTLEMGGTLQGTSTESSRQVIFRLSVFVLSLIGSLSMSSSTASLDL